LSEHNHESECRQHVIYSSEIWVFFVYRQINQDKQRNYENTKRNKAQRLCFHTDLHIAPDERTDLINFLFMAVPAGKSAVALRAAGWAQSTLAMFAKTDRVDARVVEALQKGRPTNQATKVGYGRPSCNEGAYPAHL
jgi:hypothetical protein